MDIRLVQKRRKFFQCHSENLANSFSRDVILLSQGVVRWNLLGEITAATKLQDFFMKIRHIKRINLGGKSTNFLLEGCNLLLDNHLKLPHLLRVESALMLSNLLQFSAVDLQAVSRPYEGHDFPKACVSFHVFGHCTT